MISKLKALGGCSIYHLQGAGASLQAAQLFSFIYYASYLLYLFFVCLPMLELQGSQGTEPHRYNFNHTVLASFPVTYFVTLHPSPSKTFLAAHHETHCMTFEKKLWLWLTGWTVFDSGYTNNIFPLLCGPFKLCASAAAGPKHSTTHFQNPSGGGESQNLSLCSKQR